ncbi:MAG: hypothetical protein H8E73_10255 [Planctomycetes bacterium]|nr:hypothetical protein [Planctomycetota bacterium]MBL7186813.1 hypothetical protein [Phycisphaerae bacterium]
MDELSETTKTLVRALRKKKILSLKDLCQAADCCTMTVWRNLKTVGYYTSFSHNARYWTLADTPRFDKDGLWFYREIGFSVYRTLSRATSQMIHQSTMGMTPNELSERLRVRVQNQLHDAFLRGDVHRVAWGRTQLYLSVDPEVQTQQVQRRQKHGDTSGSDSVSDSDTIAVLAELVRAPRSSANRIATILGARGLHVTVVNVQTVIDTYDLRKKGRYPRSRF